MLESPALRKIQASNSVYTRQPRRTPFMILRNQATGVSNAFPRFFPFFFPPSREVHARLRNVVLLLCCAKVDDSMFEGVVLEIVNIVQVPARSFLRLRIEIIGI